MPRITTDTGKTLADVLNESLNDECHNRDGDESAFEHAHPPTTRRGLSIVPPVEPHARNTDPHTSHTAAASMTHPATRIRTACLTAIALYGAMTGHEIAAKIGVDYAKVHKRLPELRDAGFLQWHRTGYAITKHRNGGETAIPVYQTRNSPSGRPCIVWHLNPLHRTPGKSTETA